MNILYINHYAAYPALGMEYRPYYLAREWVRMGHQVTIVAASFAHTRTKQPSRRGRATVEVIDGVRYVWCHTPRYTGNGVGRVLNLAVFLVRLYQLNAMWQQLQPDCVIASSTYPMDIYPARRIARLARARLIWEVHDLWPLSLIELAGMSPSHPFVRWVQRAENQACQRADCIVSMLPFAQSHFVAHGMPAARFVYIPNGLPVSDWDAQTVDALPRDLRVRLEQLSQAGRFIVGYTGAMGVANALDQLLMAAAQLRAEPISFVLIGQGPEKTRLMQQSVAQGLAHVHFFDPIPKSCIPLALSKMDGLYLGWQKQPIYRFGINPNKLMDYMMAAKPILHAVDAANDGVQDAQCGISVAAEDPLALAAGLKKLMHTPIEQRNAMGKRGLHYVKTHHDYAQLAAQFIAHMS